MRSSLSQLICLLFFGIASSASALTMDWTAIGNAGNACDQQGQGCFGSVGYAYRIGTYEVTNAQYAEFLNAKAASDPFGLYNELMSFGYGGITRSGTDGHYTYRAIAGRENMPVAWVSFYDALRFTNWLNNGQGSGDTETGAYTLLGGTATPSNGTTVTRNPGATIVLPSEDEWYKAAYYDPTRSDYFDYPTGSDTETSCAPPTAIVNSANCDDVIGNLTIGGSYTGSASPYGTFDQGGNVREWDETIIGGSDRILRGGSFLSLPRGLAASVRGVGGDPAIDRFFQGFRVVSIPEPGTGLLLILGLLGLAHRRAMRA